MGIYSIKDDAQFNSSFQKSKRVIVSLEKKVNLNYSYSTPLKIMPLGDSITCGTTGIKAEDSGGGYRTELWKKLVASKLNVNFVGSLSGGPDELESKAHEGHPGWRIKQISSSVEEWLNTYQPDIVLLMIGTNDTKNRRVVKVMFQFSTLLDKITAYSPNVQLLVASIPPIHPAKQPLRRILRSKIFNKTIPLIVKAKIAQGKKISFVDMTSLTLNDLTSSLQLDLDNGLHPNLAGYSKIANLWYEAILQVVRKQV